VSKNKKFSVKNVGGVLTLHQDKTPAHCPFRNPIILPGQFQGAPPQINVPACNEQCLFFDYSNPIELILNCTDKLLTITNDEQT
jgi:hypothetical protein